MRLIVARHGQTERNRNAIALGRDDVPLNETGLCQAKALGERLSREPVAAVYTSPLQRALRTAEAVAEPHHLSTTVDERLIEMHVGELDGLTFPAIRERYPGLIERWLTEEGPEHPFPGGESLVEVAERAWAAVQDIAARHPGEAAVVVTHNLVILCVLCRALGLDLARFRRLKHDVAALSVIEFASGRTTVVSINDTAHVTECG